MIKPEISVIIPFYNQVDWLIEAIQSVLKQTFDNFEVIVVDDGSTENLDKVFDCKDPRILYVQQNNQGRSVARNRGLKIARGKYIAFLDADDLFFPSKLMVQYQYMEQHPEFVLTHTSYQRMNKQGELISNQSSGRYRYQHYTDLMVACPFATPTVMVRREFIEKHKICFPVGIHVGEDICFWVSCAKHGRIGGLDNPLTRVRMHGANAAMDFTASIRAKKMILNKVLASDMDVGRVRRCMVTSKLWQAVSRVYLFNSKWPDSFRHTLRAIRSCPFRIPIIVLFIGRDFIKILVKGRKPLY